MRSKKPVEPLDTFETDVPVTAADNMALWRARKHDLMSPQEYLDFLLQFTKDLPPTGEIDGPWPHPFEL